MKKLIGPSVLAVLAVPHGVLAAEEAIPGGPSYVLPYAAVLLCVSLGMLAVCHYSRRRERPEEETDDDG